ncbi:MAG: hypothetical protein ACRD44_17200 [Bryobacteraceae bacterium]
METPSTTFLLQSSQQTRRLADLSLGKNFALSEHRELQFRADSFNAFNHTNYVGLVTDINSPTFGRLTATRGARVIQFNARLMF